MDPLFANLLDALAKQAGLDRLEPDEGMACELAFDDIPVTIQFLPEKKEMLFYCVVGTVPPDRGARLDLFARLLDANFFFRKTGGAALAADEGSGLVALHYLVRAQALEPSEFLRLVEFYIQMAEYWRGQCAIPSAADGDADSAPAAQRPSAGWMMA